MDGTETYTTRLQKVGAQLSEMRRLVLEWNDAEGFADQAVEQNLVAAPSRLRARDIVKRGFVPRYVDSQPPNIWRALATLERAGWPTEACAPLHYYCCAANERLMWDFVIEWLARRYSVGLRDVSTNDVVTFLKNAPESRFPAGRWTTTVSTKVARGLLSALRDYGLLTGAVRKEIAPVYLPTKSFAFIVMARHAAGRRGKALRDDPVWQLYMMGQVAVERFLVEAHQLNLLHYSAAGSVVRIEFPAETLEEYARDLVESTH